ncbi:MAG: YkgJ family cysteine cluster protein [Sulfurimonas sp.]|uniref:YkgJ family cysteine cluster protein n=1 Tax=Sulfurimonas sp. TaxID=2022749 RepID=UPI0025F35CF7|nr:YkgJ family cysteine cluster protein [Sulfurimonas sp.]MCK9454154.1 YkgJ family cysteine cluster protein [Sulfurimonas sp.]
MSNIIKQDGYNYAFDTSACAACQARCCTGESGYIHVSAIEIEDIANFLGLESAEFMKDYLFKHGYRYSIKERKFADSYECAFYDRESNGCTIYEVRPQQCRTFPFWDYFKTRVDELKLECPGVLFDV